MSGGGRVTTSIIRPSYFWRKDGVGFPSDGEKRIIERDSGKLIIKDATLRDSGSYVCVKISEDASRKLLIEPFTVIGETGLFQ